VSGIRCYLSLRKDRICRWSRGEARAAYRTGGA
jgi:hypothetical protein